MAAAGVSSAAAAAISRVFFIAGFLISAQVCADYTQIRRIWVCRLLKLSSQPMRHFVTGVIQVKQTGAVGNAGRQGKPMQSFSADGRGAWHSRPGPAAGDRDGASA